ncbi:MAG TPA: S41 family peptidase [Patescibacteria group bacterium]
MEEKNTSEKSIKAKIFFWVILVAVVFFGFGYQFGIRNFQAKVANYKPIFSISSKDPPAQFEKVDFSPFWQVWDVMFEKYIDRSKIDPNVLVNGAISGMVKALGDPYTAYLTNEENSAVKEDLSGSYEGVGIQLGFKDKQLVVIAPLKSSPAETAGVLPGDEILKIDGEETIDISLPEAVKKIRGKAGTKVVLNLKRAEKDAYDLELTRANIEVKSVVLEYREIDGQKVAIIKLSRFGEQTQSEWDGAVEQIQSDGVKAIILDVRNNPGGFLTAAIEIASDFVSGRVVGQEVAGGAREFYPATKQARLAKIPTVVLINQGSASASEIVAGALQDRGKAKLIGEKSFGKGTIQDVVDFESGSGVHVTIAKWLLPSGESIDKIGLKPDIEVKISEEDQTNGKDPQLDRAQQEIEKII